MSEAIYDEKIAPALAEVARLCNEHGLPMMAVVEYAPSDFGQTTIQTAGQSLPMTMVNMAARSRGNLDSFMVSFLRYCHERGIDTSASIYANAFTRGVDASDGGKHG